MPQIVTSKLISCAMARFCGIRNTVDGMFYIIKSLTSHQKYEYMYYICGQSQWWYIILSYDSV